MPAAAPATDAAAVAAQGNTPLLLLPEVGLGCVLAGSAQLLQPPTPAAATAAATAVAAIAAAAQANTPLLLLLPAVCFGLVPAGSSSPSPGPTNRILYFAAKAVMALSSFWMSPLSCFITSSKPSLLRLTAQKQQWQQQKRSVHLVEWLLQGAIQMSFSRLHTPIPYTSLKPLHYVTSSTV